MTELAPPELPGFDFEANLGRGGFADVYRFHQHRPSRQVAVKVLRKTTLSPAEQAQFENEINRMSSLSQHPAILTIYEADVTPDGRPYFTMEYCPHDHFGEIARSQPLSIARALEVGVKVAGAVETAHQAGILHRDIKPANILQTAYGEPALTDFGIAGGRDADVPTDESAGVTIPFAAPEVLAGRTLGDERSDVYSLGATVYALLAARAPFSTGRPMRQSEAINAILTGKPQAIGRADVPRELETILQTALARQPESRFGSAASFGRALQTVEAALGFPQTTLQVAGRAATPTRPRLDDDEVTAVKAPARVDPSQSGTSSLRADRPTIDAVPSSFPTPTTDRPADPGSDASPAPSEPAWSPPVARAEPSLPVPDDLEADTQMRERVQPTTPEPAIPAGPPRRPGPPVALLASVAAAVVLVLIVGAVVMFGGDDGDNAEPTPTTVDPDAFEITVAPERPSDVEVEVADGVALVTWSAPDAEDGDGYRITMTTGPNEGQSTNTTQLEQRIELADGQNSLCVTVVAIRNGQLSQTTPEVCSE